MWGTCLLLALAAIALLLTTNLREALAILSATH